MHDDHDVYEHMAVLLDGAQLTNTGDQLTYPGLFPPSISSVIITLAPGETFKKHLHVVPVYAYVLQGEVTMTYVQDHEENVVQTYRQGEAFLEAAHTWHYGMNKGKEPMRILALFLGAKGLPNFIDQPVMGKRQEQARHNIHGDMKVLLEDVDATNTGQPLAYPSKPPAAITSMLITLLPGEEIQPHMHVAPVFVYVLEGQVTLDYEDTHTHTYKQGEAFIEAVNTWHHGINSGNVPLRVLAVFIGAKGLPNTILPP
ncbi:cupin domain-containing protein [Flexibacterium corallicola]|uniref:cupin domain-containing protein n=1 Tax=Flexibacterium corallicola TaxID=3037259 RepID=UPI00286EE0C3|nr:cupin domain-containing protein [Pseudovibrio sp. M1P-2-3]